MFTARQPQTAPVEYRRFFCTMGGCLCCTTRRSALCRRTESGALHVLEGHGLLELLQDHRDVHNRKDLLHKRCCTLSAKTPAPEPCRRHHRHDRVSACTGNLAIFASQHAEEPPILGYIARQHAEEHQTRPNGQQRRRLPPNFEGLLWLLWLFRRVHYVCICPLHIRVQRSQVKKKSCTAWRRGPAHAPGGLSQPRSCPTQEHKPRQPDAHALPWH